MEELIDRLKKLENYKLEYVKYLNNYNSINKFKTAVVRNIINKIISLGNIYLINEDGSCNYINIELLKNHKFNVFAGERDRFGWLTGCIETSKGIIVFG